jgi:hypothetical protein
MDDIHSILINLITNLIWLPVGALLALLVFWIRIRLPKRKLWQIHDPSNLVVCAATSTLTNTGVYRRPATGIGQVRALAIATCSLTRAYSRLLDIQNILLSADPLHDRIENDLLILGGPKNNQLSRRFLDLLADEQPARQIESMILWRVNQTGNQWIDQGALEFEGNATNKRIVTDYGLIIRAQSPFTSRNRTVILFTGSHTYGTVAAAKFFTEELRPHLRRLTHKGQKNFTVLISTHVVDGHPTKIKMERSYAW